MQSSAFVAIWLVLLVILMNRSRRNRSLKALLIARKKKEGRKKMSELAKAFLGKECIIYSFDNQITGVIREVDGGAILIERDQTTELVNLDYVVRIREYPKKKNGKKKSIVLD